MIALRRMLLPLPNDASLSEAGASLRRFARLLSLTDIMAAAIITATLTVALVIGAGFSIAAPLTIAVAVLVAVPIGRTVLALCPVTLPAEARAPAELLLGLALFCTAMLLIALAGTLSAGTSFVACCVGSLALCVCLAPAPPSRDRWTPAGLAVLAIISAVSLAWSWEAIGTVPRLLSDGIFNSWIDFFVHAGFVTQFAHLAPLGGRSMFVAGEPIAIYHFASYMLPAAIKAFTGLPALAVITTTWGLLGFIMMGLGALVLGHVLHGRAGGLVAVAAVLLLPDSGQYLLQKTFFSFHWAQQVFCGSAYGLGLSLMALAFGVLTLRGDGKALTLTIVTTVLVAFFRVHLFVLLVLAAIPVLYVNWYPERQWLRSACLAAILPVACIGALIAERIPRAPHFFSGHFDAIFAIGTLSSIGGGAVSDWFEAFVLLPVPGMLVLVVGVLLFLTCALALLAPSYLTYLAVNRQRLMIGDSLPGFLLICYIGMLVLFPFERSREYQHRPFVLVYAALTIWCSVFLLRAAQSWQPRQQLLLAAICAPLALNPLLSIGLVQGAGNTWSLTRPSIHFSVDEGLRQAAEFIRSHAALTDVVWSNQDDPWAINTALTERTTFSSIETFAVSQPGRLHDQVLARQEISQKIRVSTASVDQFIKAARAAGIDWCLLSPEFQIPNSFRDHVAFSAGGYHVLRIDAQPNRAQ